MTTGEEIVLGLILNLAFWVAVLGGVAALGTWALIKYGPPSRPMKPGGRAVAGTRDKPERRGATTRPREPGAEPAETPAHDSPKAA